MKIIIKDDFIKDYTTREAGERLRHLITSSSEKIIIDFNGVKIASASFFDEGIAKLSFEGWDAEKISKNIEFKDIFKRDKELLLSVCEIRNLKLELK